LQVKPQTPFVQLAVAFVGGEHSLPQAPQFFGSVLRLTQLPLQLV
jgi:hypothetical protein